MIVAREVQPQLEIVVHGCEAQGGGILVTLAEDEYAKQKERINDNTS